MVVVNEIQSGVVERIEEEVVVVVLVVMVVMVEIVEAVVGVMGREVQGCFCRPMKIN